MKFYAVFDGGYDYVQAVKSEDEFEDSYGHIPPDYQPRVRSFESRAEAEEFMRAQNERARNQYGCR